MIDVGQGLQRSAVINSSVRNYVAYFTFFSDLKKNMTFYVFFEMTFQKNVKVSNLLNVYRNFDLKTPHTVLSCIVSCVHTSEQDV